MRIWHGIVLVILVTGCATLGLDLGSGPYERLNAPSRPSGAPTGSAFMHQTANLLPDAREEAIYREIKRGNAPAFLWRLKPVSLSTTHKGKTHRGRVWVTPDYLAVGSESDFVRMPMTPMTAQKIADAFGCILPTRKLVDKIYEQATIKLKPQTLRPGPLMVTNGFYTLHNQMVSRQLGRSTHGQLVAGHKKDVVLSNLLTRRPNRVAIYGWHVRARKPIQPLSTFHIDSYADYSHGIRLVNQWMEVDGKKMRVSEVLRDPSLAGLLSDEGRIESPRVAMSGLEDALASLETRGDRE